MRKDSDSLQLPVKRQAGQSRIASRAGMPDLFACRRAAKLALRVSFRITPSFRLSVLPLNPVQLPLNLLNQIIIRQGNLHGLLVQPGLPYHIYGISCGPVWRCGLYWVLLTLVNYCCCSALCREGGHGEWSYIRNYLRAWLNRSLI